MINSEGEEEAEDQLDEDEPDKSVATITENSYEEDKVARATGKEVKEGQTATGGHGQEALGHPQFSLQEASQIIGDLSVK